MSFATRRSESGNAPVCVTVSITEMNARFIHTKDPDGVHVYLGYVMLFFQVINFQPHPDLLYRKDYR